MCLFNKKSTALVLQGLNSYNHFFYHLSITLGSWFKEFSISFNFSDTCLIELSSANNLQDIIFLATSFT